MNLPGKIALFGIKIAQPEGCPPVTLFTVPDCANSRGNASGRDQNRSASAWGAIVKKQLVAGRVAFSRPTNFSGAFHQPGRARSVRSAPHSTGSRLRQPPAVRDRRTSWSSPTE